MPSGNLVQVAKSGSVRLLLGADKLIQNLDLGLTVKRASLASPHLLVMSDRGDLVLVTLEEGPSKRGGMQPSGRLSAVRANLKSRSGLANICAYRDTSGLFTEEAVSERQYIYKVSIGDKPSTF